MESSVRGVTSLACLLCGRLVRPWFRVPIDWRKPTENFGYELAWCDTCDFGQVTFRPSPDEVTSFYEVEAYYTHRDHDEREPVRATIADRVRMRLASTIDRGMNTLAALFEGGQFCNASICEIGCGSAKRLSKLSEMGHEVVGVEPDPTARAEGKRKGIRVYEGTAENLPALILGEQYDFVLMQHVLEHCIDPAKAVDNAAKLLRPGGRLVVEVPNMRAMGFAVSGVTWRWLDVPRHLNFFTAGSLESICHAADLEIQERHYYGYSRQFGVPWIREEQRIWDRMNGVNEVVPLPLRNSSARAWKLLLKSSLKSDDEKYDSVRVVARRA